MAELKEAHEKIASLEEDLSGALSRINELETLVRWYQKRQFGGGKGESQDALQLQLKLKELEEARADQEQQQRITYERRKAKPREVPAERFKHLRVEETVVIEPEEVKANPDLYERIGEEKTFEVKITPPKLHKREIVRPKYRHKIDRNRPPVLAPAPKRVIEGSYASAGLITWIILSKYREHLPLYRQEGMLKRWGGPIPRQTMSDWIASASGLLEVIYWKIKEGLLGGGYLQADETPIRFIDPDKKKGKSSKGYFWLMGRPGGDVFLQWRLGRGQEYAEELLNGFEGILQTDGYAGYNPVHGEKTPVTRVACWAHCRRKFVDAAETDPVAAGFILKLIGNLYHLEKKWKQDGIMDPAQRAHLRKRDFAMTLSLLKRAALHLRQKKRPQSPIAQACSYLLGQWDDLMPICENGHVQLDNNLIENAVRPTKLGARNWMFIGSPKAGKRSAIIYTIILSCQRAGIDPYDYIEDMLSRLPTMGKNDDLTDLLPSTWKPAEPVIESQRIAS